MNRKELRTLLRDDLDDAADAGNLWSDTALNSYLNDADQESCRRTRALIESDNPELCRLSIRAGKLYSPLDPRVIAIHSVLLSGKTTPLVKYGYRDLDSMMPGWRVNQGSVMYWCPDLQRGKICWASLPAADTYAMATVIREAAPMLDDESEPETPVRSQRKLLHWAKHLAYLKRDTDTFNAKASQEELAVFDAEFGPRMSLTEEFWVQDVQGYYEDGSR